MKTKDLRNNSADELIAEEARLSRELFDLSFKHGTRQLMDTDSMRRTRRDIARIKTLIAEKQRG
jgi:large subunit ribosomal protein L29